MRHVSDQVCHNIIQALQALGVWRVLMRTADSVAPASPTTCAHHTTVACQCAATAPQTASFLCTPAIRWHPSLPSQSPCVEGASVPTQAPHPDSRRKRQLSWGDLGGQPASRTARYQAECAAADLLSVAEQV
jgi:hypothetical protein